MDFPTLLKQKQLEMGMTITKFAKHLGKSRTFLTSIYSKNATGKKYGLSELTMYNLEKNYGIPQEVMIEYNAKVREHNERIKESTSR